MNLSIIIVTWNTKELTRKCIESVYRYTPSDKFDFEILLIDNASEDGTLDEIQRLFSAVRTIRNSSNLGFAKANNIGIKEAKGDVILLLNSDTLVKDDAIYKSYIFLIQQQENIAATACKLLNLDRSLQSNCRQFYTLNRLIQRMCGKLCVFYPNSLRANWCIDFWKHDSIKDVDWVHMAFFMIRKSAIEKIGDLDERFHFYVEDMDYCYRLNTNGYHILFNNSLEIFHIGGASSANRFQKIQNEYRKALMIFYKKYNMQLEYLLMNIWFYIKLMIIKSS